MALFVFYIIFIILSIYIIAEIKFHSGGRPENITMEVVKFIYMTNNGYLIIFIIPNCALRRIGVPDVIASASQAKPCWAMLAVKRTQKVYHSRMYRLTAR